MWKDASAVLTTGIFTTFNRVWIQPELGVQYNIQETLSQKWHTDFDLIYYTTGAIIHLCSCLSQIFTFISNDYLSLFLNS